MRTINLDLDPVFKKLLSKIENRTVVMKDIAGIMLDEVHENFNQGGRPPWRALAEITKKDRRKKGYSLDPRYILQRTGQLLKSIHASSDNDSAQVGTNKAYAGVHQFGKDIYQGARSSLYQQARYIRGNKKGKFKKESRDKRQFGEGFTFKARTISIPPRPFLVISESGLDKIKQSIVDHIRR